MNKDGRGLLADATTEYQGSRASDFRQEVLPFLLVLAISDKKKVSPILTLKNWLGHLAVICFKTVK